MTVTRHRGVSDEERAGIQKTLYELDLFGDQIGEWWVDKSQVRRTGATIYLKWENDVDPLTVGGTAVTVFEKAPAMLATALRKLLA